MFRSRASVFAAEGEMHFKNGDYYKAIDCYTKAISNFPVEFRYYLDRSICYYKIELYHFCKIDAESAIKYHGNNPDIAKCYFLQALACHGVRQFNEAETAMKKVLQINAQYEGAREELIRIRYSALISMGFNSQISLNASHKYDSIADAVDALLSQVINCIKTDDESDDFKCNGKEESSSFGISSPSSPSLSMKVNEDENKPSSCSSSDTDSNNNESGKIKTSKNVDDDEQQLQWQLQQQLQKKQQQKQQQQIVIARNKSIKHSESNVNSHIENDDKTSQMNNNNDINVNVTPDCESHSSIDFADQVSPPLTPTPPPPPVNSNSNFNSKAVRWADKAKNWAKDEVSVQKSQPMNNAIQRVPTNIWGYFGLRVENASIDNKKSLQKLFSRFGKLKGIEAVKSSKSSVWIYYDNCKSPCDAVAAMNGSTHGSSNGKPLKIYFAPTSEQPELKFSRPKQPPDNKGECYYWRTTFCNSLEKCTLLHIPQNKNIDEQIWMKEKNKDKTKDTKDVK